MHVHNWRAGYVFVSLIDIVDDVFSPIADRINYKICDGCRKVLL